MAESKPERVGRSNFDVHLIHSPRRNRLRSNSRGSMNTGRRGVAEEMSVRFILECKPDDIGKASDIAHRYAAECEDRGPGIRQCVIWTEHYDFKPGPVWLSYRTKAGSIVVKEDKPND